MHLKVDNKTLNPVSDTNNVWKNTHHAIQRYAIQPHIHRQVQQALRTNSFISQTFSTPLTFGSSLSKNKTKKAYAKKKLIIMSYFYR